jgi:hypothetical protein
VVVFEAPRFFSGEKHQSRSAYTLIMPCMIISQRY